MAWYVKRRRADGTIANIKCDDRAQVVRNFYDQEELGGDVWIEDETGKRFSSHEQEAVGSLWSKDSNR